jgi:hypothetical protein
MFVAKGICIAVFFLGLFLLFRGLRGIWCYMIIKRHPYYFLENGRIKEKAKCIRCCIDSFCEKHRCHIECYFGSMVTSLMLGFTFSFLSLLIFKRF